MYRKSIKPVILLCAIVLISVLSICLCVSVSSLGSTYNSTSDENLSFVILDTDNPMEVINNTSGSNTITSQYYAENNKEKYYLSTGLAKTKAITTVSSKNTFTSDILLIGDVNQDGIINIRDVTLIQKHIVKIQLFTESEKICADVNNDKTIDIKDATCIQRFCTQNGNYALVGTYIDSSSKTETTQPTTQNGEWLPGYFD